VKSLPIEYIDPEYAYNQSHTALGFVFDFEETAFYLESIDHNRGGLKPKVLDINGINVSLISDGKVSEKFWFSEDKIDFSGSKAKFEILYNNSSIKPDSITLNGDLTGNYNITFNLRNSERLEILDRIEANKSIEY